MRAELQQRIQRYGWDRAARDYESCWQAQLQPAQAAMLEMAALAPGDTVLDVACGTGLVTFRAAEQVGPSGSVVATDISGAMIETAGNTAAQMGIRHVTFQRVAAEALEIPEGYFDAALCGLGLMYVDNPVGVLRRMQHGLKRTGVVAVAVWGQRERCGWSGIFPIVDARVKTDVCPMFFQLGTGDTLRVALETAGFEQVEVRRLHVTLEYASGEQAIAAAFAGGPVAMAYSRFDESTRAEAHEEYLRSIAPYRTREGYSLPGEFVVARARKSDR